MTANYADSYAENLSDARAELDRARARFRALRQAGHIMQNADGPGWIYSNPEAKRVHGALAQAEAELNHWAKLLAESRQEQRAEAVMEPDRRLPREAGEDDE